MTYRIGGIILTDASSVEHETEVALITTHLHGVVLEHLLHLRVSLHAEENAVTLLEVRFSTLTSYRIAHVNHDRLLSLRLYIRVLLLGNEIHVNLRKNMSFSTFPGKRMPGFFGGKSEFVKKTRGYNQ